MYKKFQDQFRGLNTKAVFLIRQLLYLTETSLLVLKFFEQTIVLSNMSSRIIFIKMFRILFSISDQLTGVK